MKINSNENEWNRQNRMNEWNRWIGREIPGYLYIDR